MAERRGLEGRLGAALVPHLGDLREAHRLERELDTPARIFYKYEGTSPAGSHKPNTAVPQAWYNKQAGVTRLTTETGAGQWGSALSMACAGPPPASVSPRR